MGLKGDHVAREHESFGTNHRALESSELYHKHYLCQVITGKNFLSSKIAAAESCKPAEEFLKTLQTRSLDQSKLASRSPGDAAAEFDTLWLRR
jgi:hypothetical protein